MGIWKLIFLIGLVIVMSVNVVKAPEIFDTTDFNFSAGTLWNTNITPSANGGANVTLNYTTIGISGCSECGSMSAGQRNYTMTGNFTSQIFDTADTTSVFDKIIWDSELPNASNIVDFAFSNNVGSGTIVAFYRNGTAIYSENNNDLDRNLNLTLTTNYTFGFSGFRYEDIVGIGWDADTVGEFEPVNFNDFYAFFRNGSVVGGRADFTDGVGISFNKSVSTFSLPQGFNTSDILGASIDTSSTRTTLFFKNGTNLWVSGEEPPFTFNNHKTISYASNFNSSNIIGFAQSSATFDSAAFTNNKSILVDDFNALGADMVFDEVYNYSIPNQFNITSSTNITLQTHIGNTTPITTPWSPLYINDSLISDVDVNNNVGRYIQYKAVFTTPDKYITPFLENVSINYSIPQASDTTLPIVNTTFNMTSIRINDVINFTANATDETGLSSLNWTINMTGGTLFFNYTISGTSATVSNSTRIIGGRGNVYNFTAIGSDTSGNIKINSTLFTVADTPGIFSFGLNASVIYKNSVINMSSNISDADNDIGFAWIMENMTGELKNYTFSGSASLLNISQNLTITVTRGAVINFTSFYNDTNSNKYQGTSTKLTVSNSPPTIDAFQPSSTSFTVNFTTNITFNITGSDADSDTLTLYWEVNRTFNTTNQNMSYLFNTIGVFNVTANLTDTFSNIYQQWIVTVINDTQEAPNASGSVSGGSSSTEGIGDGGAGPSFTEQQRQVQEQLLTYGCPESETFLNRLTSKCRIPDNLVCDDGEHPFINKDCNPSLNELASGSIFGFMWFFRLVLVISFILYFKESKFFPLSVILSSALFAYHGTFGAIQSFNNPGVECSMFNLGHCFFPQNAFFGWVLVILIILLTIYFIKGKRKLYKQSGKRGNT